MPFSNVVVSNNPSHASNSNTSIYLRCHPYPPLAQPFNNTDVRMMEREKDMMLPMFLTVNVALTMVLIEDVLALLVMIEDCWF